MTAITVGLVQMRCEKGAIAANLAAIEASLRAGAAQGAEILCFPEMSITGYINPNAQPETVLRVDGPEVARLLTLTREIPVTALAGLVERNDGGKPFITQLVAREGRLLAVYRKRTIIHEEAEWFAPGRAPAVFQHGELTCGLAVCADIEDRTVFAETAARGARLIFEAAAPGLYGGQATRDWASGYAWWRGECFTKLGRYARELGVVLAVATQAGRTVDEDFPGGGYVFSADGTCLASTPDWSEGTLYATIMIP
jgi:predicted amidohydrolase